MNFEGAIPLHSIRFRKRDVDGPSPVAESHGLLNIIEVAGKEMQHKLRDVAEAAAGVVDAEDEEESTPGDRGEVKQEESGGSKWGCGGSLVWAGLGNSVVLSYELQLGISLR
ncbi:hypothetical protein R1sor_011163 [Riccia sorocarpa]|uniref:Uncharacterized protein n=1 Tax=Riccia sorocarpa TaxID=122646 RepID=A0ABD3I2U3_9MARC